MKIYNPFKPHIRQCSNGKFGIARLDLSDQPIFFNWMLLFSFKFKDNNDDYWWTCDDDIRKYCLVTDLKNLKVPVPKVKLTHKYYRIE